MNIEEKVEAGYPVIYVEEEEADEFEQKSRALMTHGYFVSGLHGSVAMPDLSGVKVMKFVGIWSKPDVLELERWRNMNRESVVNKINENQDVIVVSTPSLGQFEEDCARLKDASYHLEESSCCPSGQPGSPIQYYALWIRNLDDEDY